jgi:tRNA(Ile)-lysidine synthase
MNELEEKVSRQLAQLDAEFSSKSYLLATSGGSDSTCLVNVFSRLGLTFEIAHCNFQLRGEESNGDEEFVKDLAVALNVKAHFVHFDTKTEAEKDKKSIQEKARSLRYDWFNKLKEEYNFDYVVTAHHQDDLIETFFINSVRGAGVSGLKSIPIINNSIIRPLLKVSKEEVNNCLADLNLSYRQDSSNESLYYSRNYLRHKIIPVLDKVHPNAKKGLLKTINNLIDTDKYLSQKIEEDKNRIVEKEGEVIKIAVSQKTASFLLFKIVNEYGFNRTQLDDLLASEQRGSLFYSDLFVMLKEEGSIVISPISLASFDQYEFNDFGEYKEPFPLVFSEENNVDVKFQDNIAYFDAEKIQFPFILRKWKSGDAFFPLGMSGKKKLSDFFIDLKLNRIEKEQIWILESNDQICWVLGKRIDNRFKITKNTTKIIKIVTK